MFLIPLLMFCVSPFFYPPITYMEEMDYVSKYGDGRVPIVWTEAVIRYKLLQYNSSDIITNFKYDSSTMINYGTVVTTYRAYTLSAFLVQSPSLPENLDKMDKGVDEETVFARVYDTDIWHRIYHNQKYEK
jgi:hypothetical protein